MQKEITIAGHKVTVTNPYVAGHVLTEAEAKALGQTRIENISNNFRKLIKQADGNEAKLAEITKALHKYDSEYAFTLSNAVRVPTDPLEAECVRIAKQHVKDKVLALGHKSLKAYFFIEGNEAKYDAAVEKVAVSTAIIQLAKASLANKAKVKNLGSDDLGLDV